MMKVAKRGEDTQQIWVWSPRDDDVEDRWEHLGEEEEWRVRPIREGERAIQTPWNTKQFTVKRLPAPSYLTEALSEFHPRDEE